MKRTVIITRPVGLSSNPKSFIEKIEQIGFSVHWLPVLECRVTISKDDLDLLSTLERRSYSWIVLESPTAVRALDDLGIIGQIPKNLRVAVQGPGTAKAFTEISGREPDLVPKNFVAEGLLKELLPLLDLNKSVIIPCAAEGRDVVYEGLKARKVSVDRITTYSTLTRIPEPSEYLWLDKLADSEVCWVFMSPSAVEGTLGFLKARHSLRKLSSDMILSIGPVTSEAVRQAGLRLDLEASPHSEEGLLSTLKSLE